HRGLAGWRSSLMAFSLLAHEHDELPHYEEDDQPEQRAADGPRHESREAATAQQQRTAEILLEHRAEDESQHERRGLQPQPQEHVAHEAERRGDVDVLHAIVDAVRADAT